MLTKEGRSRGQRRTVRRGRAEGGVGSTDEQGSTDKGGVGVTGISVTDERGITDKGGGTDEGGVMNGGSIMNEGGIGDVARSTPTSESPRRPPAGLCSNAVQMRTKCFLNLNTTFRSRFQKTAKWNGWFGSVFANLGY